MVGAGDFIGASPLISALFFDEPSVETLNRIGLEFNAVGNHEFDKGSAELLRLQSGGCKTDERRRRSEQLPRRRGRHAGAVRGREVPVAVGQRDSRRRPAGRCCPPTASRRSAWRTWAGWTERRAAKVAFIGMTLRDTPTIVTPTGVAGLEFRDEADTVNALIPQLRKRGVDAIVVLVHQGGFQNPIGLPATLSTRATSTAATAT